MILKSQGDDRLKAVIEILSVQFWISKTRPCKVFTVVSMLEWSNPTSSTNMIFSAMKDVLRMMKSDLSYYG